MRTIAALLLLLQGSPADKWEKEIAAYESKDKEKPPAPGGIVFVGSSTIRLWKTAEDFAGLPVINRGFGGSMIADSARYADRLVIPHKPRQVLLYAGGNDISSKKTPEQAFADYQAFVAKVHAALPETKIWFMSLFPTVRRAADDDKVRALNALIAAHAKSNPRLGFIDVASALSPDGKANPENLRPDGIHLSEKGYAIVSPIVRKALAP
jgi:lysophospholipase L1-like esterase